VARRITAIMKTEPSPPVLAEKLITALTHSRDRAALIGDLLEEFSARSNHSADAARNWYWGQVIRSLPSLTKARLLAGPHIRIGSIIMISVLGFLLISFWDIYVARQSARAFAANSQSTPLIIVRAVYFVVQLTGVALAGGLTAIFAFRKGFSFARNCLYCIGPLALILAGLLIWTLLKSGGNYPSLYLMLKTALSIGALAAGAFIAGKLKLTDR